MKGTTIKKRLGRMGTSQSELARLLGITPQAVSGILSATDIRTSTVERICNALSLLSKEKDTNMSHNTYCVSKNNTPPLSGEN